ncbi:hypothetical protein TK12N_21300 [Tetragenococcus koreensis]|nr:hypothetical protein [Tetragenococcus koreensis]GEQ52786.1 hypothetical protein TK12N_21300 [Tetragenococcus koreensis]
MEQLQDFQQIELFSAENYHKKTDSFFSQMQEHPEADKIENQVGNVSWALSFLEQYIEKPGMVQALRKPLRHYTLRQLSEHANTFDWQNVYSDLRQQDKRLRTIEQKRQELSLKEDELNKWQYFDENPAILSTFNETIGLLGTVPNTELNHLKEEMRKLQHTYLEIIHQTSTTSYLLLLFLKEKSEEAHDILNEAGFQEYEYPNLLRCFIFFVKKIKKEIKRRKPTFFPILIRKNKRFLFFLNSLSLKKSARKTRVKIHRVFL